MKQTAKLGCRVLVALLCLAMFASVITVPAFAAETSGTSTEISGDDLTFLMDLLQQYNSVKGEDNAADLMKDYVDEKYNSDASFKESADKHLGGDDAQGDTLDNMNSVIDNVFTEEFTITWQVNGEVYFVAEKVMYGETPVKPADPADYEDDEYVYTFEGWSPVVVPAKANATYVAIFSATEKNPVADGYAVSFVTGNGTIVKTFASEADVTAAGINTDKATDSNYSYTFKEWKVEGNVWTAQYEKTAVSKGWADILTSGKVVEDYFGSIDNVMDAVQNGASVDDLMDSVQHQQNVEQDKAEAEERGEVYVEPTYTVTWVLDGKQIGKPVEYTYKKLITLPKVSGLSAGKYASWDVTYVLMPDKDITIYGEVVDIVEAIVADVNGLPVNYGEYEMTYENGVATLYINVTAHDYDDILRDIMGDVRGTGVQSAYKSAVMAFLQSAAMHMYNSKTNTIDVNGYEVFGIDGYGASQLVELLNTVQAGNYGEIVSASGIKNALLADPITPQDVADMGNDGVIGTYDVTLGANGKQDFDVTFNVALKGNLDLIRKAADTAIKAVGFVVDTGADLHVEIFVPGVFTKSLTKALNHAGVSDQTKQTIVAGLSECATVGELLALFDLLEYDQFIDVVEYLFANIETLNEKEVALLEKIEQARPAFDLFKKFGNILIDKVPESVNGKEASFTFKSVYNLTQAVNYDDLAALTQLKDADALVGSARLEAAVARVANKLNVSSARAQDIVMSMVDAFAEFQNRIPDSSKAQAVFNMTDRVIDVVFNLIPEKFQDAKLTDSYEGDGVFSFEFSKTYNPTAWLKNILDNVTITAYGRSVTLGDYVPTRDITSDVSFSVYVADLYSVKFVDEKGGLIFKGFLPYGAQLAPYCSDLKQAGYSLIMVDEYGDELTTMPANDTVVTVKKVVNEYTITFDVLGNLYTEKFAYGEVPTLAEDLYIFDTLNFKGWKGYGSKLPVVTGNATYVAEYTADITFVVADKNYTMEVAYGATPAPEAAWIEAIADILSFKGWNTAIVPATAHATYEADLWATIRFFAEDGSEISSVEVKYNELPTAPAAPAKPMDPVNRYNFKGWFQENGAGLTNAVAHADYYAAYNAIPHFDANGNIRLEGNTFIMTFTKGYEKGDYRWTASDVIPAIIFELAAMYEDITLKAEVEGNEQGADAVTVELDNKALNNIKKNATAEEISIAISCVFGEEPEWPTAVEYYAYNSVYSFDLTGSKFDDGLATVTVPFEGENSDDAKFHGVVYYVNEDGATKQTVIGETENALVFTTNHFSYYAVNYEQYLFTINFYGLDSNLIKTITINTDLGETLTAEDYPEFAPVQDAIAEGHFVSKWKWNTKYADPAKQFETNPQNYDFYEDQVLTAHNFGAYTYDEENHWRTCADCGYVLTEAHVYEDGECVCGHKKAEEETTVGGGEDTTVDGGEDTTVGGEDTTVEGGEDTTAGGEDTTVGGGEDTTVEGGEDTTVGGGEDTTVEGGEDTTVGGGETESGTEPPEQSSDVEGTTTPETETDSTTDPEEKKNGWWIFLIVLLVIIAILIVAYILYGHNIFPKAPATEEPKEEADDSDELTDAQMAALMNSDEPIAEVVHVDHVSASEADALMTDAQAVNSVELVACAASGKMGAVNVGSLNAHYENGEKVDIESLKEKKLIAADCKRVKILADGDLDKALIVEANSFSLQAIKMITLTGGHAIKLQPIATEAEQAPVEEASVEETPVEEVPVEETPVEETPVEETPVEETPVEEVPAEETPVEETPVEEAPAEETDAE